MIFTVEGGIPAFGGLTRRETIVWSRSEFDVHLSLPPGEPPFPFVVLVASPDSDAELLHAGFFLHRFPEAGLGTAVFEVTNRTISCNPEILEHALVEGLEAVFHWAHAQPDLDGDRVGVAAFGFGAVIAARAVRRHLVRPAAIVLLEPSVEPCGFVGIHVPSLAIVGSADGVLSAVRTAADNTEWANVVVVEGAGHAFEKRGALGRSAELAIDWFATQFACGESYLDDPDTGGGD